MKKLFKTTPLSYRASIFVLALVLTVLPCAIAQTATNKTPVILVKASNVVSEVSKRAKQQPALSPADLAAYGNDLIAKNGFDYDFDVCDLLTESERNQSSSAELLRTQQLTSIAGGKRSLRFKIKNSADSLCGECWSAIPLIQITSKEMTLIAEGNRYRVRRPESFFLDDAQLVDETLKKVLRTWQLPYQTVPVGISADGTRLYVDFYTDFQLDQLVLEISENGAPQFRDRAVIKSSEGKTIENHPTDPKNGYLSFMSFRVDEKTYRIKFSGPCT